ncbi:unnamed protein product [Linum trigynum]
MAQDMDVKVALRTVENRNDKLRAINREIVEVTWAAEFGTEALALGSAENKLANLSASKNLTVGDLEKTKKRSDELLLPKIGDCATDRSR